MLCRSNTGRLGDGLVVVWWWSCPAIDRCVARSTKEDNGDDCLAMYLVDRRRLEENEEEQLSLVPRKQISGKSRSGSESDQGPRTTGRGRGLRAIHSARLRSRDRSSSGPPGGGRWARVVSSLGYPRRPPSTYHVGHTIKREDRLWMLSARPVYQSHAAPDYGHLAT